MSYTYSSRRRRPDIPLIWRIILTVQAAMVAWIGFTHGSGFEVYLFRFADWNYKSVFSLDHNIAGVIALLGLLVLWRGYALFLLLLSSLYAFETILLSRFGGYVDNPYPLLGSAVHIVLPLTVLALSKHRWALKLLELALFASLLSFAVYFLTAPAYFLDGLIGLSQSGAIMSETKARIILGIWGILLLVSLFLPTRSGIAVLLVGLFSLAWALDTFLRFGFSNFPEAVLRLSLLAGIVLYWQADPRRRRRGAYPSLGGSYA